MASQYERRENGDGTYSQNVAVTDSDGVLPVDLRDHGMNELNPLVVKGRSFMLPGHSSAAIRDTANSDIILDVTPMSGEKAVVVYSTLNQPVTMTLYAEGTGYQFATLTPAKTGIAAGATIYTSTDWPALRAPLSKLRIRIAAPTAPTTGSISTFVEGVQA